MTHRIPRFSIIVIFYTLPLPRRLKILHQAYQIVRCPIVRTKGGIALSSRHAYLSTNDLKKAEAIYDSLKLAKKLINEGETNAKAVKTQMTGIIKTVAGVEIEYIAFNRWDDLTEIRTISSKTHLESGDYSRRVPSLQRSRTGTLPRMDSSTARHCRHRRSCARPRNPWRPAASLWVVGPSIHFRNPLGYGWAKAFTSIGSIRWMKNSFEKKRTHGWMR